MNPLIRKSVQALQGYVPGEQPAQAGLIKLNTNENPYPPSPAVASLLSGFPAAALNLYPDPSCEALRAKLARRHGCRPEQVIVGNGSDELLALCVRAFVEREGRVGYFDPSYSLYPVLCAMENVATRPVPLGEDFEWNMPADYAASLFFLTNPNAPTSLLFEKATVRAFCESFQGVVVIDEAYVDFAREDCADLALEFGHVLVTRSLSKSYSLAGIRVGYAVGPEDLVSALLKIKDSYNVGTLSQRLAAAAVDDAEAMQRNVARIRRTRARVALQLEQRGFRVFPSETNFLWTRPAGGAAEVLAVLRGKGVLVRHFPGERTGPYLRISVGTDADMDALVAALDEMAAGEPPVAR